MSIDHAIHIHQIIVHGVDHLLEEPELFDSEAVLVDEAESFLLKHILDSRRHKHTRDAAFREIVEGAKNFPEMCYSLLADPSKFVQKSKMIATHLFEVMRGNQTISKGDLVLCTYSMPDLKSPLQLAILKMDPQDGYVSERHKLPNGTIQVRIRKVAEVLPSTSLQKCAFIIPPEIQKGGINLRVLDQQAVGYGHKRVVASFFLRQFLQCRVDIDSKVKTETFFYRTRVFAKGKLDSGIWDLPLYNRFERYMRTAIQSEQIDVLNFAEGSMPSSKDKNEYLEFMTVDEEGLTELTFKPDEETKNKLGKYQFFRGDNNMELKIPTEDVVDKLKTDYDRVQNIWKITIRTQEWTPLEKRR